MSSRIPPQTKDRRQPGIKRGHVIIPLKDVLDFLGIRVVYEATRWVFVSNTGQSTAVPKVRGMRDPFDAMRKLGYFKPEVWNEPAREWLRSQSKPIEA